VTRAPTLHGGCLCGTVRIALPDEIEYAGYCHCNGCRRRSGSAFTVFGGIEVEKVRITAGADRTAVARESEDGYSVFCGECLSPLYAVVRERRYAHVQLGCLDDVPSTWPDHHIWVSSNADWHQIGDDLPQFAEFHTGEG